jgi:hypothetical protein
MMKFLPMILLLFAVLVFLVGCGKKEKTTAPQAQPKVTPQAQSKAKKAETVTPKEGPNP